MTDEQMIKEIIERRRQWGETRWSDFDWIINHIEKQQKEVEHWKSANKYNLNVCRNQSDLIGKQRKEITYLQKEFTITQNNYDMLWKDHQYLIADFIKLQDERGVIRESD